MKRGGSIFPERIDSYSQLPLLQEHSIHAIAYNSLRSAVLKIEETIGEKILESNFFGKILSLKDRINLIESKIQDQNNINISEFDYEDYTILELIEDGWQEKLIDKKPNQIGLVLNKSLLTSGSFWIKNNQDLKIGTKITILNKKIVISNDVLYIGTIVAKQNNLAQVILRNTW